MNTLLVGVYFLVNSHQAMPYPLTMDPASAGSTWKIREGNPPGPTKRQRLESIICTVSNQSKKHIYVHVYIYIYILYIFTIVFHIDKSK